MAGQWYCYIASQRYGPIPFEQLKQWAAEGHLQPDDRVCAAGQKQWAVARSVTGLFGPTAPHPPAVAAPYAVPVATAEYSVDPPQTTAVPGFQIQTGASSSGRTTGRLVKKEQKFHWPGALLAGGIALVIGVNRLVNLNHNRQQAIQQREQEQREREKIMRPPPLPQIATPPTVKPPVFNAEEFRRKATESLKPPQR